MNNFGSNTNKIDPFELGTNEYNLPQKTSSTSDSFSNGFIQPLADFSYAEAPNLQNISYNSSPSENLSSISSRGGLAFSSDGKDYLTFNQPPEWFVRENSLKIIEVVAEEPLKPAFEIKVNQSVSEVKKTLEAVEVEKPKEVEKKENFLKGTLSVAKKITAPFFSIFSSIFKEVFGIAKTIYELFSDVVGVGPNHKKPLSKEEKADFEKEVKRNVNKKQFWANIAQLSKPIPVVGAVKQEMAITNQLNGFHEEYKGVITFDANITEYHKANRVKKEIENKAHQIQAQRAAKMASGSKGKPKQGMPGMKSGELLLGTENPSHFTKALG